MIVFADGTFEHLLLVSACLFTMLFVASPWLILLRARSMNEVPTFCSKFKWEHKVIQWRGSRVLS